MDQTLVPLWDEMKAEIDKWMEYIGENAEEIVKRSPLQVGVHNHVRLEYINGRVTVTDEIPEFDQPASKMRHGVEMLTDAGIRELVPELAAHMRHILNTQHPAVTDYYFTFDGVFQTPDGEVTERILEHVDEAKKKLLLDRIDAYITEKLLEGQNPTEPLDTFFLARHLLNERLDPELDAGRICMVFDKIQQLNKGTSHLGEHRGHLIRPLRRFAENRWLPRYFEREGKEWEPVYRKKSDFHPDESEEGMLELINYTAALILKYEPSYSRGLGVTLLNCAAELGSGQARLMIREGSGTLPKEAVYSRDDFAECRANDVFAEVGITLKRESEEAYAGALRFVTRLMKLGFPKSYQIKLKSSAKQWLPVKGLDKSGTHRFFANALAYPNLHPLLEEYARAAMETYEWYLDTEGEKNCMPGSYAVFGLGLTDRRYFSLVEDYMKKVDEEHQSVQNQFTAAFIQHYGVNEETLPTLVQCMLHGSDSMKLKIKAEVEEERNLACLAEQSRGLQDYQVEHLIDLIWGGTDKLTKIAAKAQGTSKALFSELLQLAGRPSA
ncbi:DUF6138 family protein [Paenibacillus sp. CN-4]|uniref:DUF6138 family protein n=1 Tax=Paenibacillus nanchangensis TaxID=3348343 RepID=UPI00397DC3C6